MGTDRDSIVLLEGETTNTSVWLVQGEQVVAEAQTTVGARDTARDGSPQRLETALRGLVSGVLAEGEALPVPCRPTVVVAAGMLTSSLGLRGVAHVPAPAGADELAARLERHSFPSVTDLPVVLIPGRALRAAQGGARRRRRDRRHPRRGDRGASACTSSAGCRSAASC